MTLYKTCFQSPLGELALVTDSVGALCAVDMAEHDTRLRTKLAKLYGQYELVDAPDSPGMQRIKSSLQRYFCGDLSALEDVTIAMTGTSLDEELSTILQSV